MDGSIACNYVIGATNVTNLLIKYGRNNNNTWNKRTTKLLF